MIPNKFVYGFLTGVAVSATGFYVYNRNKDKVDAFLRSQGISIPAAASKEYAGMKLEELVATKERIEDIIAEMEFARKQPQSG